MQHFFTVDVEEYFQVSAFERLVPREQWNRWPRRLEHTMPVLLEMLDRFDVKGTFFVLGWVAEHSPDIVRDIARAGHEISSHGYWHRRVHTMTPKEFRDDLRRSKSTIEDVIGEPVRGFRAPSFSVVPGCEWAFDVLLEEGFRYDSSLFPVRRRGYGYPGAPKEPHIIRRQSGTLMEYPLATASIAGFSLPAAGGGYLRHFPFALIRRAFTEADSRGTSATFYIHPWEIDPGQPRLAANLLTRLRHYRGLARTSVGIQRLLEEFRFTSIASSLDQLTEERTPQRGIAST